MRHGRAPRGLVPSNRVVIDVAAKDHKEPVPALAPHYSLPAPRIRRTVDAHPTHGGEFFFAQCLPDACPLCAGCQPTVRRLVGTGSQRAVLWYRFRIRILGAGSNGTRSRNQFPVPLVATAVLYSLFQGVDYSQNAPKVSIEIQDLRFDSATAIVLFCAF